MAKFSSRTQNGSDSRGKPRVYFTCHPADFHECFDKICDDILATHDCVIYYTDNMSAPIAPENYATDLGCNNLFVVPVTFRLLTEPNRAMQTDIPYALRERIPILPIMMEANLDDIYRRPDKFGSIQYLNPNNQDPTEIPYATKLQKFLDTVLIGNEMAQRIRASFDAYIFLSYRKKDRLHANELMRLIHSLSQCWDIAIWYDEFLAPGVDFEESIQTALQGSKLFALLVTPNLLEEPNGMPNYIMAEEYPAAQKAKKDILPIEMEKTDQHALTSKFENIPACLDISAKEGIKEKLLESIKGVWNFVNNQIPEHILLVGLAYFEGIDLEVDRQRGMALIASAAESGFAEAMDWLYRIYANRMYPDRDTPEADFKKAFEWAKRRVIRYEEEYGADNPITALALGDLALEYKNIFDFVAGSGSVDENTFYYLTEEFSHEAISVTSRAYSVCCRVLGEKHETTLTAMNTLAFWYEETGRLETAQELLEKEYTICRSLFGDSYWRTQAIVAHLMDICLKTKSYQRRLALYQKVYGTEYGAYSKETLCSLAVAYGDAGDHAKEKELFENMCSSYDSVIVVLSGIRENLWSKSEERIQELLKTEYDLRCKFLGEEDHDTIEVLYLLALVYDRMGKLNEAITHLEKYLLNCQQQNRMFQVNAIEKLAEIYLHLCEFNKGLAVGLKFYLWLCKYDETNSPNIQIAVQIMVKSHIGLGNYAKALELQKKSCAEACVNFGKDAPQTLAAYSTLARIYCDLQDYTTALELQKKNYAKLCKMYSPHNSVALEALYILSYIYRGKGEYQKAIEMLQQLYALQQEIYAPGHRYILNTANELANTYVVCGEYAKAVELAIDVWDTWRKTLGENHPKVRSVLNLLAYCYYKTNDINKALEAKQRVLSARAAVVGANDTPLLMVLCNLKYDYLNSGDSAAELAFDEKMYAMCHEVQGDSGIATIHLQSNLAYAYCVVGNHETGYAYFQAANNGFRKTFEEVSFVTENAIRQLGRICSEKSQLKESVEALRWFL